MVTIRVSREKTSQLQILCKHINYQSLLTNSRLKELCSPLAHPRPLLYLLMDPNPR